MSPSFWHFWVNDVPFPKVGYVCSLEGMFCVWKNSQVNIDSQFLDVAVLTCLRLGFFLCQVIFDPNSGIYRHGKPPCILYTYVYDGWRISLVPSFPYVLWFQWLMIVLKFSLCKYGGKIRKRFPIWRAHVFQAWVETLDICGYVLHYTFGTWFQLFISVHCYPFEQL